MSNSKHILINYCVKYKNHEILVNFLIENIFVCHWIWLKYCMLFFLLEIGF